MPKCSMKFWTIPTIMTWTRIVAIPLIVGVFYIAIRAMDRNLLATVLFVVFAATDRLAAHLARKLHHTSALGALTDPRAATRSVGAPCERRAYVSVAVGCFGSI